MIRIQRMSGDWIEIRGDFRGYLVEPKQEKAPALVVLQEIMGVNFSIRGTVDRFARDGFLTLAPDLFWQFQPGIELGYSQEDVLRGREYFAKMDTDLCIQDVGQAIEKIRSHPKCNGQVACVGFCLGGLMAFLSAAQHDLSASVAFYGVRLDQYLDLVPKLRCPVLFHFGEFDEHVPKATVVRLQEAVAARSDCQVVVYPAGHGFYNPDRPTSDPTQAEVAHANTLAFLRSC